MSVKIVNAERDIERSSFATYLNGFLLSIVLTLWAYFAVTHHAFKGNIMIAALLMLAVAQFIVQIFFFLHVGRETKPRWKLLTMFMMLIVVMIVVLGSIWIMYNLNYRMTPQQMEKYMLEQAGSGL